MACVGTDSPCGVAGDDFYYNLTFTDSENNPKDLTGATARMDLRETVTNPAVVQSMSGGIIDAPNGLMRFTLTDEQTASLCPRDQVSCPYVYSVKLFYADTTEQSILTGTLTFDEAASE